MPNINRRNYSGNQKYSCEKNVILGRKIYYTDSSIVGKPIQVSLTTKKDKQSLMVEVFNCYNLNNPEHTSLYKFIMKLIDHQLWETPEASREMQNSICDEIKSKDLVSPEIEIYIRIGKIYKLLAEKYNIKNKLINDEGWRRGQLRVKSIEKFISRRITPVCYLDVGCYDGNITAAVGKHFKLPQSQTHGVDITEFTNMNKDFTFVQYDGKILPYPDCSFDLITILMTLHHVPKENLNILMDEIYRVTKPNGIIILREHSVTKEIDSTLLDIMHNFYDWVWDNNRWNKDLECGFYKNHDEWDNVFNKFNIDIQKDIFVNADKNPFMSYYRSYKKPSAPE